LKHFEASGLLCVVKGILLLDIGLNLRYALVLQISHFSYSLKICLLYKTTFVEEFYTFTKRGAESTLFLFSATRSKFCCSAKIK